MPNARGTGMDPDLHESTKRDRGVEGLGLFDLDRPIDQVADVPPSVSVASAPRLSDADRALLAQHARSTAHLQPADFDAPSSAVETSEAAAAQSSASVRRADYERILMHLNRQYFVCAFEFEPVLGRTSQSVTPRLWELEQRGLIEKCDGREGRSLQKRKTPRGRAAFAYALTRKGVDVARALVQGKNSGLAGL
jgi:hypothetical protein